MDVLNFVFKFMFSKIQYWWEMLIILAVILIFVCAILIIVFTFVSKWKFKSLKIGPIDIEGQQQSHHHHKKK